mgnify:FL=1|jgi:hypothetical protein
MKCVSGKNHAYDEKVLIRYFINEGWTRQSAVELARGMIERGSYLPDHEHAKYLKLEGK